MANRKIQPDICDYEGSNYRTEFWEGQGRDYEDRVERIALRKLLPETGYRLLEIGAGFGRLTGEYYGYRHVVLLDYSFSQLQYAQERYGRSERFTYVAANAYQLPFKAGSFDGASMIRTIHHMEDVDAVLAQVRRVLAPGGVFVLEHANKQNIKAIVRFLARQQTWSPFDTTPVEFVELNFDFHPSHIRDALEQAGFEIKRRIPVSFFRVNQLKRNLPPRVLVNLDRALQRTGVLYTPSIFIKSEAVGQSPDYTRVDDIESLLVEPQSGLPLRRDGDTMICEANGLRYAVRDGIYDFKAPLD
jgi:ubiquinone/menaquinone biosynthesis C-methylase UbiE